MSTLFIRVVNTTKQRMEDHEGGEGGVADASHDRSALPDRSSALPVVTRRPRLRLPTQDASRCSARAYEYKKFVYKLYAVKDFILNLFL